MPSCATLASSALRRCFMHLRHAHLSPGRLIDRCLHHRLFDLDRRAVLQHRLAPADLLQCQFAAFVVQLLEAIEAVSAIPHHLAGLADIAELLGQLQQSDLRPNDLLLLRHFVISNPPKGGSRSQLGGENRAPPSGYLRKPTTDCGRDARYRAPPAQIRTCGTPAYGSHLGYLTAKRWWGQG